MSQQQRKIQLSDGENIETLWAFDLGENRYRLDNQPWYAYAVSIGDIVEAINSDEGGFPVFVRVLEKCGNRTIRVILEQRVTSNVTDDPTLRALGQFGCEFEGSNGRFFAVTIPPASDFDAVVSFLIGSGLQWEHADPTYEQLHPEEE